MRQILRFDDGARHTSTHVVLLLLWGELRPGSAHRMHNLARHLHIQLGPGSHALDPKLLAFLTQLCTLGITGVYHTHSGVPQHKLITQDLAHGEFRH